MSKFSTLLVCISLFTISCKKPSPISNTQTPFLDIAHLDSSVAPGDNFFKYVNGQWMKSTEIPATEVGAGSFFDLQLKSEEAQHEVYKAASMINAPVGSLEQKVGDLYASIMDTNTIEKKGHTPLQPVFDKINNIKTFSDIIPFIAGQNVDGNDMLFNFGVNADDRRASHNIAQFFQGGIGLPDRDYYFRSDEDTKSIQNAYKSYLIKIFTLIGEEEIKAKANAEIVYALEVEIAKGHFTNVELRDPQKNYNKYGSNQLKKMSPGIDWDLLKKSLMLKTDSLMIAQPAFYAALDRVIQKTPVDHWKQYFKAHTINNSYNSLTKVFADAGFEFFQRKLNGREQPEPRWKYAVGVIDGRIGDLASQLYVKKNFDQNAKDRMMTLIDNLQKAYEQHITTLEWMTDETKQKAKAKLSAITRKIGFPDTWRKYDSLIINRDNYFQNRINSSRFEFFRAVAKVDQPVDRSEWQMTAPTVNAGYDPTKNEIIFPAGILQPPFFNPQADDAINYGAIGMVIGHELTHGFDDQGRQYDKDGNLKDWWTKEDSEKFNAITKKIVEQYSQYIPIDSLHLNGELTLGENIADIGGMAIAYDAFKMTNQGKSNDKIDGLTGDQRFYMSLATIWRLKMKDEFLRQIIHSDVHSPAEFRVNGPLTNHGPFYQSFGLTENSKMWKRESDRIKIW